MSDAMREAIELGAQGFAHFCDVVWEATTETERNWCRARAEAVLTPAVLAVVRGGVDATYEQVGWLSLLGAFYEAKRVPPAQAAWHDMEPVYRRVVPVVPSPEPAARLAALEAVVRKQYAWCNDDFAALYEDAVASPDRCLTCGSGHKTTRWAVPLHRTGNDARLCTDPWHRVPSTEGDQ